MATARMVSRGLRISMEINVTMMGKRGHQHLGDGLVGSSAAGIRIVCVQTHDGSVGILIEITDGQRLHVLKHLIPYPFQHALSDADHETGCR